MSTYTKTTDFLAKDSLPLNNAGKYVKGSEIDTEFDNIATADSDNMKKSAMGTGVETALGVNVGSAGAPVLLNGAGGTPSALVLTNATGLPTAGLVNDAVTYAKIQNVSATDMLLGRSTAGAGDVEEIPCTAFGRSLLDDADEATFKATVNLEIGTDVQAYDATLTAFAGGLTAANKIPYATALNTLGELDFVDEDNMASDSATAIPSQKSVKAYVDAVSNLTLGTAQASTSGTSIDFTGIPAGTNRISVNLSGVSTSGTSISIIQLGDSGGVENSSYTGGIETASTRYAFSDGFKLVGVGASAWALDGRWTFELLDASTNTWIGTGIVCGDTSASVIYAGTGAKSLSGTLDRIRITTQAGSDTFDAGKINITYE